MGEESGIEERVAKYEALTEKALEAIKFSEGISEKERSIGNDFLGMARNYFSDGRHYRERGDLLTALASFSYAHAWLDAGVRARIFHAEDDRLFTLPK